MLFLLYACAWWQSPCLLSFQFGSEVSSNFFQVKSVSGKFSLLRSKGLKTGAVILLYRLEQSEVVARDIGQQNKNNLTWGNFTWKQEKLHVTCLFSFARCCLHPFDSCWFLLTVWLSVCLWRKRKRKHATKRWGHCWQETGHSHELYRLAAGCQWKENTQVGKDCYATKTHPNTEVSVFEMVKKVSQPRASKVLVHIRPVDVFPPRQFWCLNCICSGFLVNVGDTIFNFEQNYSNQGDVINRERCLMTTTCKIWHSHFDFQDKTWHFLVPASGVWNQFVIFGKTLRWI